MRLILGAAPLCAVLLLPGVLNAQPEPNAASPAAAPSATPSPAVAQPATPGAPDQASSNQAPSNQAIDKRIFGVLPNYRTANGLLPYQPISSKRKLWIAAKDSFDYPVYFTAGAFAALYQLENQNPSYGQGMKGYAKRYGAAYGDQAIGNLMAEGLMPILFHEDPRYFRLGAESGRTTRSRGLYALRGVIVAKTDRGTWAFNAAEWGGNAASAAISNIYYPADTRNARDNAQKLLVAVATDAFSNVMKEFWPDIKQKYFHKKK